MQAPLQTADVAAARGAHIVFVNEAHFRADGDLRGRWTPKGEPALVNSTSPKYGEKASLYSAVCPDTGDVLGTELKGNRCAVASGDFLAGMRPYYRGPLVVACDNRGEAIREFLKTPDLNLRLVALPPYRPDYNADEAIWKWIREEVTANTCFGTAASTAEAVLAFIVAVDERADEVMRRCRTALQAQAFPETPEPSQAVLLAAPLM